MTEGTSLKLGDFGETSSGTIMQSLYNAITIIHHALVISLVLRLNPFITKDRDGKSGKSFFLPFYLSKLRSMGK